MANRILITGATGNVGGTAARVLAVRGEQVRAAVRDPKRAAAALPHGIEIVPFDYSRPETFAAAFAGVQHALLVAPGGEPRLAELLAPAVDAAVEAGVEHLVVLSAMSMDHADGLPLNRLEKYVAQSGIPHTILRPNWYMQNFTAFLADAIRQQGAIFLPAAGTKTSFIDTRDVGEFAAVMLAEPGHMGKSYTLTGPRALSYAEAADILSKASGREIRYVDLSEDAIAQALGAQGWPPANIEFMLQMFRPVRQGEAAEVTSTVRDVLGKEPRDLRDFAREHAAVWQAECTPEPA